ncbi:hypothetical protein QAD02_007271 [Eretmocerus hayati]|uniref:Uncharacterized protein n=1 Tax=Eretmocerus hayati TaxID=131215 RepID=A0ACC2N3H8_9HYME|nr:hypothetical protein QAD02_007271 [Eretmocerus hayati]
MKDQLTAISVGVKYSGDDGQIEAAITCPTCTKTINLNGIVNTRKRKSSRQEKESEWIWNTNNFHTRFRRHAPAHLAEKKKVAEETKQNKEKVYNSKDSTNDMTSNIYVDDSEISSIQSSLLNDSAIAAGSMQNASDSTSFEPIKYHNFVNDPSKTQPQTSSPRSKACNPVLITPLASLTV